MADAASADIASRSALTKWPMIVDRCDASMDGSGSQPATRCSSFAARRLASVKP
jgi:hypothetical protein